MTIQKAKQYNRFSSAGHPSLPSEGVGDNPLVNPEAWAGPAPDQAVREAQRRYPMRFPQAFLAGVVRDDPADPLWRQGYPTAEELLEVPGFSADPLLEAGHMVIPGLIQKYPDRVLLLVADACAIHCRFCFRRHRRVHAIRDWQPILEKIGQDDRIHEVIYSGGDPLMVGDQDLARWTRDLAGISHVRRLRIHSRLPVARPERITDHFLTWLTSTRLQPILVVHVNHPAELSLPARLALQRLVSNGIPLLSQSVLLKGVNDSAPILAELYTSLVDLGVMPYYLHLLDPVAGAAHFQVSRTQGIHLLNILREMVPGYAVPRLVRENPNGSGKEIL
ncbi:MAG: KamA family radical SAM protein [Magnetococcus sp. DMHC-1]